MRQEMERKDQIELAAAGVILFGIFMVFIYIPYFTHGSYGAMTIHQVNETEARSGIIVQLNDEDLKDFPLLFRMLVQHELGEDLNGGEWRICNSQYGNWVDNMTRYIEFQGKYYHVSCYLV
jgi:hypothetical protein